MCRIAFTAVFRVSYLSLRMERYSQFDIDRIDDSLCRYQERFPDLNARLSLHREPFDDEMRRYILAAYSYLNELLRKGIELFSPGGLHSMLELNHIVLCGTDPATRYEYHSHILDTRKRYQSVVRGIRKWVLARQKSGNPYKVAAGFYTRSLSRPQLFIEGNHRTENIVLNYLLLSRGIPPFIVTPENAVEYLELSGRIKFCNRASIKDQLTDLAAYRQNFQTFLQKNVEALYTIGEGDRA